MPYVDPSVDEVAEWQMNNPSPPPLREAFHFRALAAHWIRDLGYGVIPSQRPGSKTPACSYGWIGEMPPVETRARLGRIADYHPKADPLLVLDAFEPGVPDLDVMDVDDPAHEAWVIATFGNSPLRVSSGRDGGGVHLYYRRDSRRKRDERGSRTKIGGRSVDFKSHHGYIVAPGAVHRTGRIYTMRWSGVEITSSALTREMFWSLPPLDRDVLDSVIASEKESLKKVRSPSVEGPTSFFQSFGLGLRGGKPGVYPSVRVGPAATFTHGRFAGRSLADAAREIGEGKALCCCPFDSGGAHKTDLHGGTTAILHATGGKPTKLFCFACSVSYTFREPLALDAPSDAPDLLAELPTVEVRKAAQAVLDAVYRDELPKVEARRLEAEALDPRRVEEAKEVLALAKTLVHGIRRHCVSVAAWQKTGRTCGFRQALLGLRSAKLVGTTRLCGKLKCAICGPWKIAVKVAALCVGSVIVTFAEVGGRATTWSVGRGFGLLAPLHVDGAKVAPAVYVYEMDAPGFRRWKDSFKRKNRALRLSSPFPASTTLPGANADKGELRKAPYIYGAFERAGKVTVISDLRLPRAKVPPQQVITDLRLVQEFVHRLALDTYRVETVSLDEDSPDPSAVTVTGSITSSNALHLDAEEIVTIARASEFVVVAAHAKPPAGIVESLRGRGIGVRPRLDGSQVIVGWETEDLLDVAVRRDADAAALTRDLIDEITDADGFRMTRDYHEDDLSDLEADFRSVMVDASVLAEIEEELCRP